MSSIGEKLRRARLEKGLTVDEVASRIKVASKFLVAIEADRRDELPAGFFFRNWALQYARALSLDEKEILGEIDRIAQSEAPLPLPGQERRLSIGLARLHPSVRGREGAPRLLLSFGFLLLVVLGCSGFYAWWHKHTQEQPPGMASSIPERTTAVASHPPVSTERRPPPPPAEPATSQVALTSDALLLEIVAKEPTWLSISPDGRHVFSGVLEPNQTKTIEAKEFARLKIGNAGGLEVRLNGKPVGDIGPRGQVRILLIGPSGVHILEPRIAGKPEALVSGESDRSAALPLPLQQ
jgi:cytoskeleton protein RodZ